MPVVFVTRKPKTINDELILLLRQELPGIIAQNLSIPDGPLAPENIELRFIDIGPFDIAKRPLEILVLAHDYPERRETIDQRTQEITDAVSEIAPSELTNFWVWIFLGQGGFSKFEK